MPADPELPITEDKVAGEARSAGERAADGWGGEDGSVQGSEQVYQ